MPPKTQIDAFGAISLTGFALFARVSTRWSSRSPMTGCSRSFFAALRSVGGALLIYGWIRWRGLELTLPRATVPAGLLIGAAFAFEFICLFLALDLTTVTRTSVIFYTMPLWLALAAHVLIPGERLTRMKSAGLILAFAGVVVAMVSRGGATGQGALLGDLFALGAAMGWAGIALIRAHDRAQDRAPGGAASVAARGLGADPACRGAVLRPGPARAIADPLGGAGLPDRGRRLGRVPVLVLAPDDLPGLLGRGLRVLPRRSSAWGSAG